MDLENIHTERLTLEPLDQAKIAAILQRDDRSEICRMFGIADDDAFELNRSKFVSRVVTPIFSTFIFRILFKQTDIMVGWCGFHTWFLLHDRAELGYMLLREQDKRLGYMSEVLPRVLEFGFRQMKLHRIEAIIGPDNVASLKLVAKLGFTQEGVLRQHYKVNDVMDDSILFSLLKNESGFGPEDSIRPRPAGY